MNNQIRKLFTTTLLILLAHSVRVSAQDVVWTRNYGGAWQDGAFDVARTYDGGLIVTGFNSSSSSNHLNDIVLLKTDASGNEIWSKTFGGNLNDIGTSVRQTRDGGFIVAGMKEINPQTHDPILIRTDEEGNLLWEQTYDYGLGDDDRAHSVWETADGGYILAGQTWLGFPFGSYDFYVVKTNVSGNVQWRQIYSYDNSVAPGADVALAVQQLSDGGYIIGGFTNSTVWASYLIRTDSLGNEIWDRTYGGDFQNECSSVQAASDGGFILTGTKVSPPDYDSDVLLIKTDANGIPVWEKVYGGLDAEYGESVRETRDGGFVITGITSSFGTGSWDIYVVRTSSSGNTLWTRSFGETGDDRGWSVETLDDGCIIVAGWAWSYGAGLGDAYLMKLCIDTPVQINKNTTSNPLSPALYQNYPNPFNPVTNLEFGISDLGFVTLKVYDLPGREIAVLVNEKLSPGNYKVEFNGANLPSGVYFYTLSSQDFSQTKKMILIK